MIFYCFVLTTTNPAFIEKSSLIPRVRQVLMVVRTAKQTLEAPAPPAMAGIHCQQDHVPLVCVANGCLLVLLYSMQVLTETVVFVMSPIRVIFATMAICFSLTILAICVLLRGFTDTRMLISLLAALLVCLFLALLLFSPLFYNPCQ
jgi:hypothetical protein